MGRGHILGKCCKNTSSRARVSWLCVARFTKWHSLAWVYGLPCFVTKGALCSKRATNCACLFSTANSLKIVWIARRSSQRSKHGRRKTQQTTTGFYSSINIINTISFLVDPNQSQLHFPWPRAMFFFPMQEREEFWLLFVIGWNADSVAWTRCTAAHTKRHRITAKFCSCNMSHKVEQVELRATCRADKIAARFVLEKSLGTGAKFRKPS